MSEPTFAPDNDGVDQRVGNNLRAGEARRFDGDGRAYGLGGRGGLVGGHTVAPPMSLPSCNTR